MMKFIMKFMMNYLKDSDGIRAKSLKPLSCRWFSSLSDSFKKFMMKFIMKFMMNFSRGITYPISPNGRTPH
jgi:hypothetical protein